MGKANILLLHHDRLLQKSLYELLCRKGFRVDLADCVETAMRHLDENPRRVILTEINETANRLAKLLKRHKYPSQIVLLTSYAHPESASETLELGAFEYLVRPVEDEKIIATVEKALASVSSLIKECAFAKAQAKKESTFYGLVGKSAQMQQIYSLVQRIADTKATVLLRGESGTGKRMIAHAIHQASAKRKNKPFVEVSCGALPREIIESELFGHTKGSFTGAVNDRKGRFELAHGGTILLDDIDSFSLEMQVKLLRVLQQKEFERVGDHKTMNVDVRVVASTNQNLEKAVAEKAFREDLYYRLNVISLCVPPLRERKEDLPLLIDHFVNHYAKENHKTIKEITEEVRRTLTTYHWPGNVRELENIIERAVILDTDNVISRDDLPDVILNGTDLFTAKDGQALKNASACLKDALKEPERIYILKVLQEVGWNKKRAANKLGLNRTTLYNKLKRYNLLSQNDKLSS